MSEKVESKLAEVESEMKEGEAEAAKPKKVKKVAKKAKKVAKKATKTTSAKKAESNEGKVTLAELATEAGITSAAARRKLRDAELNREGRWAWDEGSKGLKEARAALGIK